MGKKALSKSAMESGRTFWEAISFISGKGYNYPKVADTFHDRNPNLKSKKQLTGVIEKEGDGYVVLCPELDIASQGDSIDEAKNNLAATLEFLRVPPGNRLEKLQGDRVGRWSIRINERWRICFRWDNGDAWDVEIADYH
jgi:plasmid maintenance system killer protein